jgi:hypothetical protein
MVEKTFKAEQTNKAEQMNAANFNY